MTVSSSGTSGAFGAIPVYDPKAASTAATSQGVDQLQNDFLKMLVAQIQYQDPMEPMENNEFTNQLAMMSSLNEQQQSNSLLQQLLDAQTIGQVNQAVSYIGRGVVAPGNTLRISGGAGELRFNLSEAASATVRIKDKSGNVVKDISMRGYQAGDNRVLVNDAANGLKLADGDYTFSVITDAAVGGNLAVTPLTYGLVTGVSKNSQNQVVLSVNGHDVTLDQILRVEQVESSS